MSDCKSWDCYCDAGAKSAYRVYAPEVVQRCIVDKRPPGCVEIEHGVWFYLPFIVPPQEQWSPYP